MLELFLFMAVVTFVIGLWARNQKSRPPRSLPKQSDNKGKGALEWLRSNGSWLVLVTGWAIIHLAVWGLFPTVWKRYWENQQLFWIIQIGVIGVSFLWTLAGKNRVGFWLGMVILCLIIFAFGREMWEEFAPALSARKKEAVVWRELCSAEEQVPFTKPLPELNREDSEMVNLPAITPRRCLKLEVRQEEFGKPFVFTYKVSRKGFDAKGTITLKTIREESDGWDRVLYSETYTNPLDGPRTHQAEGLLWCKDGHCNGVGKDPSGKPLARRLLLGKVFIEK